MLVPLYNYRIGNFMIALEHINLVVRDLKATLAFYQAAFPHWRIRAEGDREWHGKPSHWIHFGDDYTYLAFSDHGEGNNRDLEGHTVGLAHFAFTVNNLDSIIKRLESKGYSIAIAGAESSVRKNCYFLDPNGYEIEFVEYLSDIPEIRNSMVL